MLTNIIPGSVNYCDVGSITSGEKDEVYVPKVFQPVQSYSQLSSKAGNESCFLTIVTYNSSPRQLTLNNLNTTANASDPVLIFAGDHGMKNNLTYMSLNRDNVDQFDVNFTLPGTVFTFKVPANQELNIFYKNSLAVGSKFIQNSYLDISILTLIINRNFSI